MRIVRLEEEEEEIEEDRRHRESSLEVQSRRDRETNNNNWILFTDCHLKRVLRKNAGESVQLRENHRLRLKLRQHDP